MRQALIWGCAFICWLGSPTVRAAYVPGTTNLVYANGETGASYLLYLPTGYDMNNPPPLVLYFDPGANSGYGMSKLQPSCEAAGWVLACANELRNEAIANEEIKVREIMDDVRRRIPHDRRRFYAAGLSGGAWRANSLSREYWNEVAGLLLFGCWIGDYDDYTVFPDRLAVARVNGLDDNAAIAREPYDSAYYTQTMVRVRDIHFNGGHEIGPTNAINEALTWLDADFSSNGVNYVSNAYETAASALVASAQAAWDSSQYDQVVSNAVTAMYRYPMSSHTRDAERLLFQVVTNDTMRAGIHYAPDPADAWPISWMLMQRGLGTDADFPGYYARAYFATAVLACPTNARALAECAHQILVDPNQSRSEWPSAADLAGNAFELKTNHWRASYVQYELAELLGDMPGALAELRAAINRMPGDLGNDALSNTYEACVEKRSRYLKYVSRIEAVPLCDDFEQSPMNRSVVGRHGWMVSWGAANNQTQMVHNGLCALAVTGRQSLAYMNCLPVTNQTVWLDFYIQPARAGCDFTNPLPPLATTMFQVRSNGLLRVYDGATGNWVTLAHDPMPTGRWSRISIQANATNQQWAIWLNDQEVAGGLGLAHSNTVFSGCCLLHDGDSPTYLDDLTVSTNPPVADSDLDGLPDAWEDFYELDASDSSDAGLDPDGDYYANCEEYRLGTSPKEWDAPPDLPNYVGLAISNAGFVLGGMSWSNDLYRHARWSGEALLATTNSASMNLYAMSGTNIVFWGTEEPAVLTPPATTVLGEDSAGALVVSGPLNALYRVRFDGSTGEFSIEWAGFHDSDGDTMMDEWEVLYCGTTTGLTPYGNPDGDAYPNLIEYFRNTDPLIHDYYSPFTSVSVTGTFINWNTTYCDMELVGDHVWQYRYWWGDLGKPLIKLVVNHSWDVNWGDNNQVVTNVPFRDTADLGGANIVMNVTNGQYEGTITFNDATRKYAVVSRTQDADMDGIPDAWEVSRYTNTFAFGASGDPDGDGRVNVAEYLEDSNPFTADAVITTNSRINVVGNFSGWNTALNPMEPAGNHLWKLDLAFTNLVGVEFKFVANGSWSTAWGASNSTSFSLPLQGLGNPQGGSPNFKPAVPLDGVYRFTFNEACVLCTLDYAPSYILHQTPEWTVISTNRALMLKWLSSSDRHYSLYRYTNLMTEPELLGANIPATPPLNVITQAIDPELRLGIFQVRLEK